MAHKRNQQKSGWDQISSKNRKGDPDSVRGLPDAKGRERTIEVKVSVDELPSFVQENSPLMDGVKRTISPDDGRKKTKKSVKFQKRVDQGMDATQGLQHLVHIENNSTEDVEDFSLREKEMSYGSSHNSKCLNHISRSESNVSHTEDVIKNVQFSYVMILESFKAFALSILQSSSDWVERQGPFFVRVANNIKCAHDYIHVKFLQTYPIVFRWFVHVGNVLLLVSMAWLDCAFRGMYSFLRMGTTSFFSVIWCCILSMVAMIGICNFLLVLAIAALIAIFLGFIAALTVIVVSGAVILWMYGSFWTTSIVIVLGGLAFALRHEHLALLITTMYSIYCAWIHVGWLGILLGLNLSFISSDALLYFLKSRMDKNRSTSSEQTAGMQGEQQFFNNESHHSYSEIGSGQSADRGGFASTSRTDSEITSEGEVVRLLNCTDHYSALGLPRYEHVDVSLLKREYRKKAMLVHPDKNMGNDKAAEAFKKLQNAYEVLLDSLKRNAYDDELRREELLNYFHRFQGASQQNGQHGFFSTGFARSEADNEDPLGKSRKIACKKCGNFHIWVLTKKSKAQARWCQDCKGFHQAKDGDGWVEQSSQPFLFGILQKVDAPTTYVCAKSRIYDATEWYNCQGMRCPANSHKPTFHVNTNVTKHNHHGKGMSYRRGGVTAPNAEENMTEEGFFEWLQNAVQAGMFDNFVDSTSSAGAQMGANSGSKSGVDGGGGGSSSNKRKKKVKKQW
ncbi:hypothetical protein Nepgr_020032 [Nepenthes gracilis]|uniref:J domain-containing protein n=1 Tax=Nepenthes gracilis TaxID=150966 RepID=A0AAD3SWJ9_NEPGR|nr:hypothetical protein Nepgr_020032 [Nepenthes gracilis]